VHTIFGISPVAAFAVAAGKPVGAVEKVKFAVSLAWRFDLFLSLSQQSVDLCPFCPQILH
jgi:hypothetical protein